MTLRSTVIPQGTMYQHGSLAALSPNDAPGLGGDRLRNAMARLEAQIPVLAADLKEEVLPLRLYEIEGGAVVAAAREAFEVERAEARAATEASANFTRPVQEIDAAIATYTWSTFAAMDRASAAKSIETADLETLTALTSRGNKARLDPQVFERASERYRTLNWAARQQLDAKHPLQPSPSRVLAIGVDRAAVEADAAQMLADHAARLDRVKAAEGHAQDLVRLLAAIFAVNPVMMLDRITGRAA